MKNLKWIDPPADRDPGVYAGGRRFLIDGKIETWTGAAEPVFSPVHGSGPDGLAPRRLGEIASLDADAATRALKAAVGAYDRGRGHWPTAAVSERIRALGVFLDKMTERRLEVARLLCFEVGKPWADALVEFDRTVAYGRDTIEALKDVDRTSARFSIDGGFLAQIRRAPYGVALCLGPFNYPLNETFTTLLPALVMGNTAIVKLPRAGMLCNLPLLEAFAEAFPPGVVNVIGGDGPTVISPIIRSGDVDLLAFIGSAKVANLIKHQHPKMNRLRAVLGLGAKNPAIVLKDANLAHAAKECVSGALTFNGQRCTALKILWVERAVAEPFVAALATEIGKLRSGMPFEDGVNLTPLVDRAAVERMKRLTDDAVAKGARIANEGGGEIDRTYFHPALLYPVAKGMEIHAEEQFGPIVPVVPFDDPVEVLDDLADSPHGQQASVFAQDPSRVGPLVDALANQVCRVNIN